MTNDLERNPNECDDMRGPSPPIQLIAFASRAVPQCSTQRWAFGLQQRSPGPRESQQEVLLNPGPTRIGVILYASIYGEKAFGAHSPRGDFFQS